MDPRSDMTGVNIQPVQPKKKKRKRHIGLWITLGVLFCLIVAPVAALYACFYDGEKSTTVRDPDFVVDDALLNASVDALDNIKDTKTLDMRITGETLNKLLLSTYDANIGSNADINQFITGLSLETTDTDYTFLLDVDLYGFFKTRVRLVTSLSSDKIEGKDAYIFKIVDLKLGRIGGLYSLVKQNASAYLNDEYVNSLFSSFGISLHSDMENDRIYYLKEDIPTDIANKIGGESDLFSNLMKTLFDVDTFDLTHSKEGIRGEIDLARLSTNDEYVDHSKDRTVDWSKYRDTLVGWMDDGYVAPEYAKEGYEYLLKGSSYSSYFSGASSPIRNADLTKYPVQISDLSNYSGIYSPDGVVSKPEKDLKDQVTDQISIPKIYLEYKVASISETTLNEELSTSDIIGNCYLMKRSLGGGKYKVNPMTVSNMYANITENGFKIVVEVDINGYPTYICVNAAFKGFDENDYSLSFEFDEVYYGEAEATEEFKSSIFDLIGDGFKAGNTFEFDKSSRILKAKFGDSVDNSSFKKDIENMGNPDFVLTGVAKEDEGTLDINLIPKASLNIQNTATFPKDRIISYFDGLNGLGTTHSANILPYTSDDYRSYEIDQTIKETDEEGQEIEKTYQTIIVDTKDKNYDAENPDTLPLLTDYHNVLLSGGFTHTNPLTDEEGNKLTGDEAIRKDNYNIYAKEDIVTRSVIVVGVRQIEEYFQVFYSIRALDTSSITPSSLPAYIKMR